MIVNQTIADAWSQFMVGSDIDVGQFVDALLSIAVRIGPVSGRMLDGSTSVGIGAEPQLTRISDIAALTKLRMICARLATVFGTSPYSGAIERDVEVGGTSIHFALAFSNHGDDIRFIVTPRV